MRYFWWAEFQKRGALHYHAMIVDAPFSGVGEARQWFTRAWRDGGVGHLSKIQPHVDIRSAAWFRDNGADYVMKDAHKGHRKGYQQDYSKMPRGWRTFRCHQLAFSAAEHARHEDKAWTVCVAANDRPWHERQHEIYVFRVDHHVPGPAGHQLTQRRSRKTVLAAAVSLSEHSTKDCLAVGRQGETPRKRLPRLARCRSSTLGSAAPRVESHVAEGRATPRSIVLSEAATGSVSPQGKATGCVRTSVRRSLTDTAVAFARQTESNTNEVQA